MNFSRTKMEKVFLRPKHSDDTEKIGAQEHHKVGQR